MLSKQKVKLSQVVMVFKCLGALQWHSCCTWDATPSTLSDSITTLQTATLNCLNLLHTCSGGNRGRALSSCQATLCTNCLLCLTTTPKQVRSKTTHFYYAPESNFSSSEVGCSFILSLDQTCLSFFIVWHLGSAPCLCDTTVLIFVLTVKQEVTSCYHYVLSLCWEVSR